MSRDTWTAEKLFSRRLTHQSKRTYWDTIGALRKRPTQAVFDQCRALINSGIPKERIIGIDVLAQLGVPPRPFYKEALTLFFEMLAIEKDPNVLLSLLDAIGHNNDQLTGAQVEKLCYFTPTTDRLIKEGLVFSLLGLDDARAIQTLVKLSTDKRSHIRNWATFGIGSQTERDNYPIREALWNRVNDKHPETKLEAIAGLAKRKDNRVKDLIIRELAVGQYGVALLEAILEIGDPVLLSLLKNQYTNAKKQVPSEWLEDLNDCITALSEKLKTNS